MADLTKAEAEERSLALLRALVPAEEWFKSGAIEFIRFTNARGVTYTIYFNGTVENILQEGPEVSSTYGTRERRHICGGPFIWNEFLDVEFMHARGYPRVDPGPFNEARDNGTLQALPLPDFYLAQYLALKYDERAFLEAAHGGCVY